MLRALPLVILGLVAACTDDADDCPRLVPTQQILAEPALPDHAGPAASSDTPVREAVQARGAAARGDADAIPDPVNDAALANRAADLRRRAEALRNLSTDDDACQSGATAPNCPPASP